MKKNHKMDCWAHTMLVIPVFFENIIHLEFMISKKKHYQFIYWPKNSNLNYWYANCRDFSKAWQMKLKLWHLILQEIVKVTSGRKIKRFAKFMCWIFLSLPIAFSHSSECKPISDKHPKHTYHCFHFFPPTTIGALPMLQECPTSWVNTTRGNAKKWAWATALPMLNLVIEKQRKRKGTKHNEEQIWNVFKFWEEG